MRHFVISGPPRSTVFFQVSHKLSGFRKKKGIENKMCVLVFFLTFETFFILSRIKRGTIKTVYRSSCKVPCSYPILTLILPTWRIWWAPNNARKWQMRFNSAFKGLMKQFSRQIFEKYPKTKFHKNPSVGSMRADRKDIASRRFAILLKPLTTSH